MGIGTFTNKTITGDDPRSILYKTKELFRQRRVKTLISGFGTHADFGSDSTGYNGEVDDPRFGESRGRNLLTLEAERNGGFYNINGYNNPYCRVWTHHYQYSKLADLMRPFDGETTSSFHKWDKFSLDDANEEHQEAMNKVAYWGWKYNNEGWKNSVLDQENGLVNIAPKYVNGGGTNIHTKDCMFSIENLAWKDYDPYMFEKSLSWEQRGPMGGRIMWFPPYDISFSENVSAKWNQNDFIGRGEAVYSYANTVRSGTLSFLMVIDHPSVVDYALWGDSNNNGDDDVHDTDLLRFFAGCDDTVVLNAARPTPLTDEYLENIEPVPEYEEKTNVNNPTSKNAEKTFKFRVYFPNNYTGVWDLKFYDVDPIDYLIHGSKSGFDMNGGEAFVYRSVCKDGNGKYLKVSELGNEDFSYNKKMDFDNHERTDSTICDAEGCGYEITKSDEHGISYCLQKDGMGVLGERNYSTCEYGYFYTDKVSYQKKSNLTGDFVNTNKCFYRMDGCGCRPNKNFTINNTNVNFNKSFEAPVDESYFDKLMNTPLSNTWGQILGNENEYMDIKSLGLNCSEETIVEGNEKYIGFVQVGQVLTKMKGFNTKDSTLLDLKKAFDGDGSNCNGVPFSGYNVEISVSGYASTDGNKVKGDGINVGDNRNKYLALGRAYTI